MNKLSISVSVDRKAAALRGLILPETVQIAVGPEDVSPETWAYLISQLNPDMSKFVMNYFHVSGPEVSDLVNALDQHRARKAAEKAQEQARLQEERQQYIDRLAERAQVLETNRAIARDAELQPAKVGFICHWQTPEDRERFAGLTYDGFKSPELSELPWLQTYSLNEADSAPVKAQTAALETIKADLSARVVAANLEALEKARPELEVQAQQRDQAKALADAQALADQQAMFAKRLATGIWTMETPSYKSKRYSSYWCAKVTFPNGPKAVYEFGESTGKWGAAGYLSLNCLPGEIIAWGQKDLRRPDESEHHLMVMRPDGGFNAIADKVDAYKVWQAKNK